MDVMAVIDAAMDAMVSAMEVMAGCAAAGTAKAAAGTAKGVGISVRSLRDWRLCLNSSFHFILHPRCGVVRF